MKARIKAGNDNRQHLNSGAKTRWSEILDLEEGTDVNILSQCPKTNMAVIQMPNGAVSPSGKKNCRPGEKRLVPTGALESSELDALADGFTPWGNKNQQTYWA